RVLEVSTGKVAVTQQVKAIVGDNKITVDMGKTTSAGVYVLSIDGDGVQYNPTRFVLGKK
ncbi:MAG: hypothetical protein J0I09_00115, partial [Sphingobacteriia bacterium]|nr:hypothetical protein [Sphingobacteriia bacterium]